MRLVQSIASDVLAKDAGQAGEVSRFRSFIVELGGLSITALLLRMQTAEESIAADLLASWVLCCQEAFLMRVEFSQAFRRSITTAVIWNIAALWICGGVAGCAGHQKCYSRLTPREELRETKTPVTFRYGRPNWCLDGMQKVVELPSRVMLGGRLKADRVPSEETREVLTDYLQENDLSDIPVLVNDYDPVGQWQRLRENDQISPAWKYTAGMVGLFNYTVFPGRVFARDTYSPFTNTLHVNTGRLSDSLHAAAYAKDIRHRKAPGTYAVVNSLPGLALWKTTIAVQDVVAYAQAKDSWQLESGVYRDQYPQVAVKTMAPVGLFMTPVGNVALAVSGGAVGYAVGRTVEQQRIAERDAVKVAEDELSGRADLDDAEETHSDRDEDSRGEYGS